VKLLPKEADWGIQEISKIEIQNIKNVVTNFYDEWLENTSRQKKFTTHENTFMYELINYDYTWNFEEGKKPLVKNLLSGEAQNELQNIYNILEKYSDGKVIRSEIISMNPKSRIRSHKDRGDILYLARRFHIPIKTNLQTFFVVEDKQYFLNEGFIYELNNIKYHKVENNSDESRIHLIVDVLPDNIPDIAKLNKPDDFYVCPFCISSWICHGPHIDQKDFDKFDYRIKLIQSDISAYAKEIVLKEGENINLKQLADLIEKKIQQRNII
jgi:hypothetical protein